MSVFASNFPAPYNNIASPFHQDNNAPLVHFFDNPDRLPKDGWELIKYNLGYLENGTPNGLANRNIYIVLYNKYTGILRVFVASNESIGYNGARVTVEFHSGIRTSMLSNTSEIFALDTFKPNPSIIAVIGYRPALWSYADFHMAYDPCTCKNDSRLKIVIDYITTSTIKLNGAINGTIVTTAPNGTVSQVNEDGYSFSDLASGATKAKKTYDDFQGFVNQQFNAIENEGKTNLQVKAEELLRKNSLTALQLAIKTSSFLTDGLKALPYIGIAVDLLDFFIGGGKQSDGPLEVKIMPMTLQADVTLSGEMKAINPYPDIVFNTPGSKNVPCKEDVQYPYYNEVLGVFNLLETPKIYVKNLDAYSYTDPNNSSYYYNSVLNAYQAQPIKYLLNPSAGFRVDNVDIMASLDFGNFKTSYVPLSAINSFSVQSGNSSSMDEYSYGTPSYTILGCTDGPPIAIQLLINLQRVDATANTQNVLMKLKMPFEIIDGSSVTFAPAYCTMPKAVTISNQTLYNDYFAWEEIVFGPNVSFTGKRVFRAPNIVVQPNTVIPANVTLQNGLPNGHVPYPVPQASQSEIETFCASTAYNTTDRIVARKASSDEDQPIMNDPIEKVKAFTAFPNPVKGVLHVVLSLEEANYSKLTIMDLSGQVVAVPLDEFIDTGERQLLIDASVLPAGIYVIRFQSGKLSASEKLVVIK